MLLLGLVLIDYLRKRAAQCSGLFSVLIGVFECGVGIACSVGLALFTKVGVELWDCLLSVTLRLSKCLWCIFVNDFFDIVVEMFRWTNAFIVSSISAAVLIESCFREGML